MKNYFLYFFFFTLLSFSQDKTTASEEEKGVLISVVEKVPIFPGCDNLENSETLACFNKKMQNHILKHFSYPEEAMKKKIEGKVYVSFLINKEGDIVNVKTKGADPILQEEARRIFSLLPKMKPGIQRGKAVNVSYIMPLNFKLQ